MDAAWHAGLNVDRAHLVVLSVLPPIDGTAVNQRATGETRLRGRCFPHKASINQRIIAMQYFRTHSGNSYLVLSYSTFITCHFIPTAIVAILLFYAGCGASQALGGCEPG